MERYSTILMETILTEEDNCETENKIDINETTTLPFIKHIVCSGGGVAGFIFYGILKESHVQGLWDLKNIQTMYGTSIGSMINVMISLNYSWQDLGDYLIHRPWDMVYKMNMYSIIEIFTKKGVFDCQCIQETLSPLLKGKELSVDITMQEFYEYNGIELHIFTTELNRFENIDISYKTHPDWKVVDAVYCSCCLPILCTPYVKGEQCFYDGGILMDYPLNPCILNGANPDEILSMARVNNKQNAFLNEESTFFEHISTLIYNYVDMFSNKNKTNLGKNEIFAENPPITIQNIMNTTTNCDERIRLIEYGEEKAREFMEKLLKKGE